MDIFERLKQFLAKENEKSGNGWPEIPIDDLNEFASLIDDLIEAKWGRDCDSNLPIRCRIYDRKHRWMPYFSVLPHFHKLKTVADKKCFIRALFGNTATANADLDRYSRFIEEWLEESS